MATITRVTLTCDLCGDGADVTTWTFGLDDKTYEIDLCLEDGKALVGVTTGYIAKARKMIPRPGRRPTRRQRSAGTFTRPATAASSDGARGPRVKVSGRGRVTGSPRGTAQTSRPQQQAATADGGRATGTGSESPSKASHPQNTEVTLTGAAEAAGAGQHKGIYVYGILPDDIEMAADVPGVGEHPGLLRDVRFGGLAALISDVDLSGQLGSPGDLRTYREILDATATEVPVVPLRFGTVLISEDAVARELLAAYHDEFAAALERLEGRAEFQVTGRYARDAVISEVVSQKTHARRLREVIEDKNPDTARPARIEFDRLMNEVITAWRAHDTRTLRHVMERLCVASVARHLADDLDAVHVAFLIGADSEREAEQAIKALARKWDGRIDLKLTGPMAAYDFAGTAQPED